LSTYFIGLIYLGLKKSQNMINKKLKLDRKESKYEQIY